MPCCSKMTIPRRSAGFLWDRTLEDVVEDDDYEMEQEHNKSGEETVLKYEENEVLIGKEEYSVSARTALRISASLRLITTSLFSSISLLFLLSTLSVHQISVKN